jgi:hypothetical protein
VVAPVSEVESAVTEHLITKIEERLADRGGGRHVPGWEPRQNVVVGVLEPRRVQPPAGDHPGAQAQAEAAILNSDDDAPPFLGLDFTVRPSGQSIELEVDCEFAVYVEEYPTREEQQRHFRPAGDAVAQSVGEDSLASPHDKEGTATQETPLAVRATSAAAGGAPERGPKKGHPGARARTRLISVWRRHDIAVNGIHLVVQLDGSHSTEAAQLERALRDTLDGHFAKAEAARPFSGRTREVEVDALSSDATFWSSIRAAEDNQFATLYPDLHIEGFADRLGPDLLRVSVSLANATSLPERPFQDLTAYDCRIRVTAIGGGEIKPQRFELAPTDYRYRDSSEVVGHGRACVAIADGTAIASTTLPRYYQPVVESREDHVTALNCLELYDRPAPVLDSIEAASRAYLDEWDGFLAGAPQEMEKISRAERDRFADEMRRFRLGREAMKDDARLARAFRLANGVMAEINRARGYESWRLFQLVFIVTHLAALAGRERRTVAELTAELDFADVLWFPTGGGKTEAYLGLIVTALFYDRLRGKQRGITSWLKFPLRMLSVQQLLRVLRVLIVADRWRERELGPESGDPFALGYLVGGGNTPNLLRYEDKWWPGIKLAADHDPSDFDAYRLVTECPSCGEKDSVHLKPDLPRVRLFHVCSSCHVELPLLMSDEEIYRYMPSVIVGTVDKLTGLAFYGEFTQFSHGPRYHCPDHGWFTFGRGGKCLVGDLCERDRREYLREGPWYDPVPALIVQDELHLLREELGAFDAHYEGMLAEIQRESPSGLPSKMLAASATIEQSEDQLRQVYGRRPRSFPTPGFERHRSFYSIERTNTRRVYLGILPHYRRKADVAGIIQVELLREVARLQDLPPGQAADLLGIAEIEGEALQAVLFNYEVSLSYVNSKVNGDQIADELARLSEETDSLGGDQVLFVVLTGQVNVSELASAIDHVEQDRLSIERSKRLRGMVGTSVVSHGVDLERLNVMVMAGLPPTVADYIQATSRAGRIHVGLVATVFDAFSRRERSSFVNFPSFHRFLDRMVEPAPVNKYALFAAQRTLPGLVMALLWDLCRQDQLAPPPEGVHYTRHLSRWWNAKAPELRPIIRHRLERGYRSLVDGVNERSLEDELAQRVLERWERVEMQQMQGFGTDLARQLFREPVLTSFRDVDEPVDFSALPLSANAFGALTDREPG